MNLVLRCTPPQQHLSEIESSKKIRRRQAKFYSVANEELVSLSSEG
jgi:hypothetical protein